MKSLASLLAALLLVAACSQPSGPVLTASEIDLRTPIAGRAVAPGYLTLTNNSREPIAIDRVESPHFRRIEMHETINDGQISRMRKLDAIDVAAGSTAELKPGGMHLMLFTAANQQSQVTLNFYSGESLLLSVTTGINTQ